MLLVIEISVSIFLLAGLALASFVVGFLIRRNQIRVHRKKIVDLEKEMLSNHARILELEKEKAALLTHMKESQIPVIQIKSKENDDKNENRKKA
jgi:hypothetical protein